MAYTKEMLRKLFQSTFDIEQWKSFLQHLFKTTRLSVRDTPEEIVGNTSDKGYYLGSLKTTDHYHIGLFCYKISEGSVSNKRVGLRNLVKSFINPTWGVFDAALVVFDDGKIGDYPLSAISKKRVRLPNDILSFLVTKSYFIRLLLNALLFFKGICRLRV